MTEDLIGYFEGKKVLILGFGREGRSSFNFFRSILPPGSIGIADQNESSIDDFEGAISSEIHIYTGQNYLDAISDYDLIIKSPGIPKDKLVAWSKISRVTSQTNLFLKFFKDRIIGVTGTKGKSTTSSLIKHILYEYDKKSILVGNIGVPPFDYIGKIHDDARIVYELSSHQLDDVSHSPHIAVFLNLFEEHLDHYGTFEKYGKAKSNIFKFQNADDFLVLNLDDINIGALVKHKGMQKTIGYSMDKNTRCPVHGFDNGKVQLNSSFDAESYDFSKRISIPGDHNLRNIMAAVAVARIVGIPHDYVLSGVNGFKGLEHRLEYVGEYRGIHFYNDSIATVPEATIEAIKTLKNTDTLILGGRDRGIDYSTLVSFLPRSGIRNFIFMGKAGQRIEKDLSAKLSSNQKTFLITAFSELSKLIPAHTQPGKICLLSPAASSYDWFENFEERGRIFKKIAESL